MNLRAMVATRWATSGTFSSLSGADGEEWWGLAEDPERLIRTNEGKQFDNGRNPDVARLTQGHPRPRPDAVRGWHNLHRGARLDGCRHRQGGAAARRSWPHRLRRRLLFHDV